MLLIAIFEIFSINEPEMTTAVPVSEDPLTGLILEIVDL